MSETIFLVAAIIVCALILLCIVVFCFADTQTAHQTRHAAEIDTAADERDEIEHPLPVKPALVVWGDTREKRGNYNHVSEAERDERANRERLRRDATPRPAEENVSGCRFFTTEKPRGKRTGNLSDRGEL